MGKLGMMVKTATAIHSPRFKLGIGRRQMLHWRSA
ncbi:MAG: hypothetical protein ACI8XO_000204 [Verrucomicrobiales bacterium]|jgi:hypothetical protein